MKQLKQRLTDEIQRGTSFEVSKIEGFYMDFDCIEVEFEQVFRKRMDILLKMMLQVIDTIQITSELELAKILSVEMIFITSLLDKLCENGLIQKESKSFRLTHEGKMRVAEGFYMSEPSRQNSKLYYQNIYAFFVKKWTPLEDKRYTCPNEWKITHKKLQSITDAKVIAQLMKEREEKQSENKEIIIEKVLATEVVGTERLHFLQLSTKNKETSEVGIRIWNLHAMCWDDELRQVIEEG